MVSSEVVVHKAFSAIHALLRLGQLHPLPVPLSILLGSQCPDLLKVTLLEALAHLHGNGADGPEVGRNGSVGDLSAVNRHGRLRPIGNGCLAPATAEFHGKVRNLVLEHQAVAII